MGIGKKGKKIAAMKRSLILSVAIIMAASTVTAAPVSYAVNGNTNYNNGYNGYGAGYGGSQENEEAETTPAATKDTSWFDYYEQKDRYEISNEAQLLGFASLVNENQVDKWKPTRLENFEDVTFVLTKDIELTTQWTPVGSGVASYFAGTFDGNGHTISGLDVNMNSGAAGLFGYLVGTVKDLTVEGTVKSGDERCGGIAGVVMSEGSIVGCTSDVKVEGRDKVGGIAGYNNGGLIETSINIGSVSGSHKVGGVVGENWGTVFRCGNRGDVESTRRGVGTFGTGGVAGRSVSSDSSVSESFNQGKIISNTEATGGVVGYVNAEGANVSESYNTGEITIDSGDKAAKMSEAYGGGIIGIVGSAGVRVMNCYNAAAVLNADVSGGIIGAYINDEGAENDRSYMENNYYPGGMFTDGIGQISDENDPYAGKAVSGISLSSFKELSTSMSVIYKSDDGIYGNNGYPVLMWQEPIDTDEKEYIENIDEATQKRLDRYLAENAENSPYGHDLVKIFSPANYVNDSIVVYTENINELNS